MKEGMRIEDAKNALLDFYPYKHVKEHYGVNQNQKDLREIAARLLDGVINDTKGEIGEAVRHVPLVAIVKRAPIEEWPCLEECPYRPKFEGTLIAIAQRAPVKEWPLWPQHAGEIFVRLDLIYTPHAIKNNASLSAQYAPDDAHAHIAIIEEHEAKRSLFIRLWKRIVSFIKQAKEATR